MWWYQCTAFCQNKLADRVVMKTKQMITLEKIHQDTEKMLPICFRVYELFELYWIWLKWEIRLSPHLQIRVNKQRAPCSPTKRIHQETEIQLLESPIPTKTPATTSKKASSCDISGTKRGIIDPLASKRPEKFWIIKFNALSNHCTVAWVTRPERLKGMKDEVKQARRASS